MTALQPRSFNTNTTSDRALDDAGGLWLVEHSADRQAVVAEARERGARAR